MAAVASSSIPNSVNCRRTGHGDLKTLRHKGLDHLLCGSLAVSAWRGVAQALAFTPVTSQKSGLDGEGEMEQVFHRL